MAMKTTFIKFRMALPLIVLLISGTILYTGCSKSSNSGYGSSGGSGSPGPNEVWMQNTKFVPSTLTISVNTTVTWTNKDGFDHDVTASDSSYYSGNIPSGGTYTHLFKVAGTYNYGCKIHPGMTGVIIVQ